MYTYSNMNLFWKYTSALMYSQVLTFYKFQVLNFIKGFREKIFNAVVDGSLIIARTKLAAPLASSARN